MENTNSGHHLSFFTGNLPFVFDLVKQTTCFCSYIAVDLLSSVDLSVLFFLLDIVAIAKL